MPIRRQGSGGLVWDERDAKISWGGVGALAIERMHTVAQVTTLCGWNLSSTKCVSSSNAILIEEGEKPDTANRLAVNTTTVLATGALGPRPFGVSSPSGADYSFFVQRKGEECLLRLYGRQKGFTRYTNNLTYIATRSLEGLCLRRVAVFDRRRFRLCISFSVMVLPCGVICPGRLQRLCPAFLAQVLLATQPAIQGCSNG